MAGLLLDSVFLLPIAAILSVIALGIHSQSHAIRDQLPRPCYCVWSESVGRLLLVGAVVAAFAAGWVDQTFPAHWGALFIWFVAFAFAGLAVYLHDRRPRMAGNQQAHPHSPVFNLARWEWLVMLVIAGAGAVATGLSTQ